jgi:hypothetical protein
MKIHLVRAELFIPCTDGWTDMMKLIVTFRNFANTPKNLFSSNLVSFIDILIEFFPVPYSHSSKLDIMPLPHPSYDQLTLLLCGLIPPLIYNSPTLFLLAFSLWASLAGTTAQSGDWYGSGMLHSGQVLRGSLPLLSPNSPTYQLQIPLCMQQVPTKLHGFKIKKTTN